MPIEIAESPAEVASLLALTRVFRCLDEGRSFRLEAGAGAGKTYSLIKALQRLIEQRGAELLRSGQRIACITFTNAAKQEIEARTDRHPAVRSETIHGFCWSMLKDFQPLLRGALPVMEKRSAEFSAVGGIGTRRVEYDLGFFRIKDDVVTLQHDDVPALMVRLLENPKFRRVVTARCPVLFIDEYQDTDVAFMDAIKKGFLDRGEGPLIGFFGDHWQKIYGTGCGKLEHAAVEVIDKGANFRSASPVVSVLNAMRPALPQVVCDPTTPGEARVFHTNNWQGQRRTGPHWDGDTSPEAAHAYLGHMRALLALQGWNFAADKAKILMLTHNGLAGEQGYPNIPPIYTHNDGWLKKGDAHIKFLADNVEPACAAFLAGKYGQMFESFGAGRPLLRSHAEKVAWFETMTGLVHQRESGTIGDLIDYMLSREHLPIPDAVRDGERALAVGGSTPVEGEASAITRLRRLRGVAYSEMLALDRFLDGHTPFDTKHGVKGLEFENVLVVVGRGWNQYNFEQMLSWAGPGRSPPAAKAETFERNRNLFYVACSRPRKRLAVLFTQQLGADALATLGAWFGFDKVTALPADPTLG